MATPKGPVLGPLGVDVDPLVVVGGVGEEVDPLLGDRLPLASGRAPCRRARGRRRRRRRWWSWCAPRWSSRSWFRCSGRYLRRIEAMAPHYADGMPRDHYAGDEHDRIRPTTTGTVAGRWGPSGRLRDERRSRHQRLPRPRHGRGQPGGSIVRLAGVAGLVAGVLLHGGRRVPLHDGPARAAWSASSRWSGESLCQSPEGEAAELRGMYVQRGIDAGRGRRHGATRSCRTPSSRSRRTPERSSGSPRRASARPGRRRPPRFVTFALGAFIPLAPWLFTLGDRGDRASVVLSRGGHPWRRASCWPASPSGPRSGLALRQLA